MRRITRKIDRRLSCTFGYKDVQSLLEVAFEDVPEAVSRATGLDRHGARWCGATWQQTREWTTHGAPQLAERLSGMLARIELPEDYTRPEMQRRRRRTRGDFGNEVDIHAVYQGRCDRAWDRMHVEAVPTEGNRLVHVVIDLSAAAVVSAYDGLWRAAAAMRIYDALLRLGKSVAISVYDAGIHMMESPMEDNPNGTMMVSVRVKDYGQPLREDMLAATTVMPFLRHVLYTAPFNGTGIQPSGNLGFPISDYGLRTDAAEQDMQHGGACVVIGQAYSQEMAQEMVDKFLRTYVHSDAEVEGFTPHEQTMAWR